MDENEWIKEEFAEVNKTLVRIDEAIRGNGKEGLVTRVVKLEQVAKVLIWIAVVLTLPVVGLLVTNVWAHFSH